MVITLKSNYLGYNHFYLYGKSKYHFNFRYLIFTSTLILSDRRHLLSKSNFLAMSAATLGCCRLILLNWSLNI